MPKTVIEYQVAEWKASAEAKLENPSMQKIGASTIPPLSVSPGHNPYSNSEEILGSTIFVCFKIHLGLNYATDLHF